MGFLDFLFGPEKKKVDTSKVDAEWQKRRDRQSAMSWILGNEVDLINRQHGKRTNYSGKEGGIHPKDKDTTNNDWW